jgi:hypothetical protein
LLDLTLEAAVLTADEIEQALKDIWQLLKRHRSPVYTNKDVAAYNRLKDEFDGETADCAAIIAKPKADSKEMPT